MMVETPRIVELDAQDYAATHRKVPVAEIGKVMGPAVQSVGAVLQAQEVEPAGPWFTHHFVRPMEFFDVEICFPTAHPIKAQDEVYAAARPAMKVAQTVFHGNYSGLPKAWGELEQWMAANGHKGGTEFWEVYTVNPNNDPSPERWRTELNWPLA